MKKLILIFAILVFMIHAASGFYLMNRENSGITIGESYKLWHTNQMNPGQSGYNVSWDFSSLELEGEVQTHSIIHPDEVPGTIEVPSIANKAIMVDADYFVSPGYEFYQLKNDGLFYLGAEDGFAKSTTSPPLKTLQYPLSYNDSYTVQFVETFRIGNYEENIQGELSVKYDGYGTLKLPWGTISGVSRLKYISTIEGESYVTYHWRKPGLSLPLLSMPEQLLLPEDSLFWDGGMLMHDESVGIYKNSNQNISGFKVYPNPVTAGKAEIQIQTLKELDGSLSVIDMNGRVLKQIHTGLMHKGKHKFKADVSTFQAGIYVVRFKSYDSVTDILLIIGK